MWDPAQYQRFGDERARPFFELTSRINAAAPRYVVDLGSGPGELTAALADRWPGATVEGLDSSPEMIEQAQSVRAQRPAGSGSLEFRRCDVRDFHPSRPPDVIVSNAVLHWVPGHHELLKRWAAELAGDGWLAFQIPGNFGQSAHRILGELASSPRWRAVLDGAALDRHWDEPSGYLDLLTGAGCEVDAWETTYLHVLQGSDPVLEWVRGTALRPVLAALQPEEAAEFTAELGARLRAAYPARVYGTVFPFRRIFVVAHRHDNGA
jgi:trans-aconitate 2-methyltransferase